MIYLIVTEAGMEPEYHSCKCVGDICYFGYTLDVETAMDYISQFSIYKDMKMVPRSKPLGTLKQTLPRTLYLQERRYPFDLSLAAVE